MSKFEVTLRMVVKAATSADALGIGISAAEHLNDTFNDDESIDARFGVEAKPMSRRDDQPNGVKR